MLYIFGYNYVLQAARNYLFLDRIIPVTLGGGALSVTETVPKILILNFTK